MELECRYPVKPHSAAAVISWNKVNISHVNSTVIWKITTSGDEVELQHSSGDPRISDAELYPMSLRHGITFDPVELSDNGSYWCSVKYSVNGELYQGSSDNIMLHVERTGMYFYVCMSVKMFIQFFFCRA